MIQLDFADLTHLRLRCARCRETLAPTVERTRDEWRLIGLACPDPPCGTTEVRVWLELPPAVTVDAATDVDLRNLSLRCDACDAYPTLIHYDRGDGVWNAYTYSCETEGCDPVADQIYLEVRAANDRFARRDPAWRGGKIHAGAGDSPDD